MIPKSPITFLSSILDKWWRNTTIYFEVLVMADDFSWKNDDVLMRWELNRPPKNVVSSESICSFVTLYHTLHTSTVLLKVNGMAVLLYCCSYSTPLTAAPFLLSCWTRISSYLPRSSSNFSLVGCCLPPSYYGLLSEEVCGGRFFSYISSAARALVLRCALRSL